MTAVKRVMSVGIAPHHMSILPNQALCYPLLALSNVRQRVACEASSGTCTSRMYFRNIEKHIGLTIRRFMEIPRKLNGKFATTPVSSILQIARTLMKAQIRYSVLYNKKWITTVILFSGE